MSKRKSKPQKFVNDLDLIAEVAASHDSEIARRPFKKRLMDVAQASFSKEEFNDAVKFVDTFEASDKQDEDFKASFGDVSMTSPTLSSPKSSTIASPKSSNLATPELLECRDTVKTEKVDSPSQQSSDSHELTIVESSDISTKNPEESSKADPGMKKEAGISKSGIVIYRTNNEIVNKIFSTDPLIPWYPMGNETTCPPCPPELQQNAGSILLKPFRMTNWPATVYACHFQPEVHEKILLNFYDVTSASGIALSKRIWISLHNVICSIDDENTPNSNPPVTVTFICFRLIKKHEKPVRSDAGGQKLASVRLISKEKEINTSPFGPHVMFSNPVETPYRIQGALPQNMSRRALDVVIEKLYYRMANEQKTSKNIEALRAEFDRLKNEPPVYFLNDIQLREGYFRTYCAQYGVRPSLAGSRLGRYLQHLSRNANDLFKTNLREPIIQIDFNYYRFFSPQRTSQFETFGTPQKWITTGPFFPNITQDRFGNYVVTQLFCWIHFPSDFMHPKSSWKLVDVSEHYLDNIPMLLHHWNTGAATVWPWPDAHPDDPHADFKCMLLLSLGFTPHPVKPVYISDAFLDSKFLRQIGFLYENNGPPSPIQVGQITLRMENLLFRLMTPQLAEKVFTSSGPVEDKAFRFKLISSKLQRFFNGDVMQAGKELPELAISKAYKVMPELFKTFVNVAPSRHIAELILFANMAIPFSENASIMNIFGCQPVSSVIIHQLSNKYKPAHAIIPKNTKNNVVTTEVGKEIIKKHFEPPSVSTATK